MLDDISLFVVIVRSGSLKEASRVLGLPAATVSRRLKALEQSLMCRLVHRSSHQFTLTNEGQELYQQSAYLVESLNSLLDNFSRDVSGQKGKVKVLAPLTIVASTLQPMFSRFMAEHQEIQVELEMRNELTSFLASGADFGIRIGPQHDSELSHRKLGESRALVVAAPDYAAKIGTLNSLDALSQCHVIMSNPLTRWKLEQLDDHGTSLGIHDFLPPTARVTSNEMRVSKLFVLDGLGVSLLPINEIIEELKQGRLVNVMPNWFGAPREIFAVWYRRQLLTNRASMLMDFIQDECQEIFEPGSDVRRFQQVGFSPNLSGNY
ncbi:LysR family transcriptional regulator [Litoribrevibacter euphylliae]|uniref:LysR family transcriptional regulator n=1 Tax=Litoribrevibacter euphylliae TaxID=1834034 RepID=A0ABV7HIG2_9GAMM